MYVTSNSQNEAVQDMQLYLGGPKSTVVGLKSDYNIVQPASIQKQGFRGQALENHSPSWEC